MHPFSTPWKHQKTVTFFDVFRGQKKGELGTNGLNFNVAIYFKLPLCERLLNITKSICNLSPVTEYDPQSFHQKYEINWLCIEIIHVVCVQICEPTHDSDLSR